MATWSEMCAICRTHLILTGILMLGLFVLLLLIDYYKLQKKKGLIWTFASILIALGCATFGLSLVEPITLLQTTADANTRYAVITIGSSAAVIMVISFVTIIIVQKLKEVPTKKLVYTIFFSAIALMGVILIAAVIMITWILPSAGENLHLGSFVGLPALLMLSVGTIVVTYDEPKLVIYHGLTAGGSWVLTLMNVIALFGMSDVEMTSFSGVIHTFHILCGAIGLLSGFFSALFGISGQRKLAKLTGYITLGCWWTAYFVSQFITGI